MSRLGMFSNILKFGSFEEFEKFALFIAEMKNYSVFNAALIYCQRPGAIWVETEHGWNKRERNLKPNATPIVVLKPFEPVEFVYDLEDTYGKPFNKVPVDKSADIERLNKINLKFVEKCLNANDIYYGEKPLGEKESGFAKIEQCAAILKKLPKIPEPVCVPAKYAIVTNSNKSTSEKYITIIHELGHILCGHLGQSALDIEEKNVKNKIVKDDRSYLTINEMENEAEAVCKVICRKLGVDYNNENYLKGYRIDGTLQQISMNDVIAAADKICRMLYIAQF